MSDDPSRVIQYLAEHDAPCPSCGYSLKGCAQPCCPECGDQLILALRGESSNVLIAALRYVLWGLAIRSLLMTGWALWSTIYYSIGVMGASLGSAWYVRVGVDAVVEIAIGVLSFAGIRRLKLAKSRGIFQGTATLVAWIAILEVAKVFIGVVLTLGY